MHVRQVLAVAPPPAGERGDHLGFQSYPEDYEVVNELHRRGELTLRIAYNLFTQKPGGELADFTRWAAMTKPGAGDDLLRVNGAGEMLTFSAADFEDFLEPRPDLPSSLEGDLTPVVRQLVKSRWPFRLHATYGESISRFLDVFEAVDREVPFDGLRWFFDHAETIRPRDLERVKALGGGIAVQHRMAYQGEYFAARYGAQAAREAPPVKRMLATGLPVGAGTDGTRVASYNPWVSLSWLTSGRTVGGAVLFGEENRLDRMEALRLYTVGSAWFSGEEAKKGALVPGALADLAVLSADYFTVPDAEVRALESVLTVLGGKVVHAAPPFGDLAPPPLPVGASWSPVGVYGGYHRAGPTTHACASHPGLLERMLHGARAALGSVASGAATARAATPGLPCDCFAF